MSRGRETRTCESWPSEILKLCRYGQDTFTLIRDSPLRAEMKTSLYSCRILANEAKCNVNISPGSLLRPTDDSTGCLWVHNPPHALTGKKVFNITQ
jgi:hypothetical protein